MVWLPLVPRVERARPASDEFFWRFGVLGQTRARQGGNGGWRRLAERAVVGATECAPYPAQAPYITHACARDTQVPSTFRGCCSERAQQREAVCQAGRLRAGDGAGGSSSDGAGGGSSEAGRVLEGDEKGEKSHTQADRQVRRQGDVIYRGTDCACAAGLIPACSSTSGATRRRPASS